MAKTRLGFVSNSSSSSFVIALDNGSRALVEDLEATGSANSDYIENKEELLSFIDGMWGYDGETLQETIDTYPWLKGWYEKALVELEQGNSIMHTNVDYYDSVAINIVDRMNVISDPY